MIPKSLPEEDGDEAPATTRPDLPRYRPALEALGDDVELSQIREALLGVYTLLRTLVFLVFFNGIFELGILIWNAFK